VSVTLQTPNPHPMNPRRPQRAFFALIFTLNLASAPLASAADLVPAPERTNAVKDLNKLRYLGMPVPGLTPERFAPGLVCTPAVELNAVFSPDGREFYFTRLIDGIDTLHQIKFADGKWGAPRELLLFPNRVRVESADMFISADNRELYFLANFSKRREGQKPNYDLWVSRRVNGDWALAELVPPPVSTVADEMYPILGKDGSLYFSSGREGKDCVYRAMRRPAGGFDQPQKVELALKGEGSGDMCLAPDESYLIMTPQLPGGRGRGDLHVAFRQPDGSWGELISLGDRVNTAAHEWCPMVTPDGKYLFFSRWFGKEWGDAGDGEVYWVDIRILDELRPKAADSPAK